MADATVSPSIELRRIADRFWDEALREDPVWATMLGDRRFDDRLEDRSPEGVAANEALLRQTLAETRTIDAAALSASERVTHSMLIDVVEGNLAALGTRLHEWTVDPMNGPQTLFLDLPEYQTVTTPE